MTHQDTEIAIAGALRLEVELLDNGSVMVFVITADNKRPLRLAVGGDNALQVHVFRANENNRSIIQNFLAGKP